MAERGDRTVGEPKASVLTGAAERKAAFDRLAERHLAESYRLAALILGDRSEAEDATHEAAIRAWRAWSTLRDRDKFEPWFQRILVNVCRSHAQRRRVREVAVDQLESSMPDPNAEMAERAAIRAALGRLTPAHRVVVVLRFYADLSIEEIAERTGDRAGTVRSRLHYALRELRAAYDAGGRVAEIER